MDDIAFLRHCLATMAYRGGKILRDAPDGFGDFVSSMFGHGKGNNVHVDAWVQFPHSLGLFYTACTQYIGFARYGDEYKIMGLAPYGEPA